MRITAGAWRGRKIPVLDSPQTSLRPTSDRMRQAIFNLLLHNPDCLAIMPTLEDMRVLDAFCGSGALGLEALSRGAGHAVFWDKDHKAVQGVRDWCTHYGVDAVTVEQKDALKPKPAPSAADLIFLDPPYGQGLINQALSALSRTGYLTEKTLSVCEGEGERPDMRILVEKIYGRSSLFIGIKEEVTRPPE